MPSHSRLAVPPQQSSTQPAAAPEPPCAQAFCIPPPNPTVAKQCFDQHVAGVFRLLQAGAAQSQKIRNVRANKVSQVCDRVRRVATVER